MESAAPPTVPERREASGHIEGGILRPFATTLKVYEPWRLRSLVMYALRITSGQSRGTVRHIVCVAGAGGAGEGICKSKPACGVVGWGEEEVEDFAEIEGELSWVGGVVSVTRGIKVRDRSFFAPCRIDAIGEG